MSSGCECEFIQVTAEKWYYLLENYNAPKNAWDWRDNATAYGPFSTEEVADKHLQDNHQNPGGSSTIALPKDQCSVDLEKDPTLKWLIENAAPARSNTTRYRW